ncbi:MAG TPA: extracellular solute-binding protein [Pseudonocardiaceae bacterium]|nr:extracellular solute-binding protein [Pseudonocardiaceae bacterium]
MWIRGNADSEKAYQDIFAAFTKKTGIKVTTFATLTDFETKVNAAAAGHTLPDVVVDDAAQLGAFRAEGVLQQVNRNSIAGGNDLTDLAWTSAKGSDGNYYAVPFSAQANILLVRTDWLNKTGDTKPTTWADLLNVAKSFTTGDPDGDGKADTYGVAVPGSTSRGYISWYWSTFLWEAGGDYFHAAGNGKYTETIDSPQAVTAARWFENLFCTDKVVQPGALNDVTTDSNKAFDTGVAGLYLTGPYAYATMDATSIDNKYTAIAPPAGPKNASTLAEGTDVYLMAGSKHTSAAQQLAEYMITPSAQKLGMTAVPSATIVRLSINRTVNTAAVHDNDPRWVLAQQVYQQQGHYEPDYMPNWPVFRQDTSNALNAMVANCADPTAALHALGAQFTTLLRQQGVLAG